MQKNFVECSQDDYDDYYYYEDEITEDTETSDSESNDGCSLGTKCLPINRCR